MNSGASLASHADLCYYDARRAKELPRGRARHGADVCVGAAVLEEDLRHVFVDDHVIYICYSSSRMTYIENLQNQLWKYSLTRYNLALWQYVALFITFQTISDIYFLAF
jgi:hypothetical protein